MRQSLARFAGALALVVAAVLFAFAGLAFWVWSLYLYSARHLPADAAALATGLVTLLVAGLIAWAAKRLNQ